ASSTCVLALMRRPCSSQVYQVTPTPASCATSSRRRPGVRRRGPGGRPTSSGVTRSRLDRRKLASSVRRSARTRVPFAGAAVSLVMDTPPVWPVPHTGARCCQYQYHRALTSPARCAAAWCHVTDDRVLTDRGGPDGTARTPSTLRAAGDRAHG